MYKFGFVLLSAALFAFALARPAQDQTADAATTTTTPATIIKQIDVNNPDGSFNSRLVFKKEFKKFQPDF